MEVSKPVRQENRFSFLWCDKHRLQVKRNVFPHLNFKWLCELGKHPLSFSQGQLDPGCPTKAYLTMTDEAVCQVRGEMEVSEGGSPTVEWLPSAAETLTHWPFSLTSQAPCSLPMDNLHTYTPGQTAQQARRSRPTLNTFPSLSFTGNLLSTFTPSPITHTWM